MERQWGLANDIFDIRQDLGMNYEELSDAIGGFESAETIRELEEVNLEYDEARYLDLIDMMELLQSRI